MKENSYMMRIEEMEKFFFYFMSPCIIQKQQQPQGKKSRKERKIRKSSAFIHVEMWKCERKFYARSSILYLNSIYDSQLFGALRLQTKILFYAQKCVNVA